MDFKLISISRHRLTTDGEGVTSLVALAGCPLRCPLCINRELLALGKVHIVSPEKLLENVMKDYCYFVATGGGITFGGGEPLIQADAIIDFFKIRPEGLNINIETSMNVDIPDDKLKKICEETTMFIIDTKSTDPGLYKKYTGLENERVFKNLEKIKEFGYEDKCILRVPVIPKLKDKEAALKEKEYLISKGFNNINVFPYIIRDYMDKEALNR